MLDPSVYRDIPRFYTAIAQGVSAFLYLLILPRRFRSLVVNIVIAAAFFCLDALWLVRTTYVVRQLWLPCMLAAFGIMLVFLSITLKSGFRIKLYVALKSFLLAEFMASLEWQLQYFKDGTKMASFRSDAWLVLLIYGGVFIAALVLERRSGRMDIPYTLSVSELISVMLIVSLTFSVGNLSFVVSNSPFSAGTVQGVFSIRTFSDLTGIAFIYAYQSRVYEAAAEQELNTLNTMLKAQYDRYRNYQESINLINIKYHDLKHQLAGLRSEEDPEKRSEWIRTLDRELETYRPQTQTGNQVLDGIIDQKLAFMKQNGIQFTCVADGKLLDFMHVTDICTIFGNAIDNAAEHVVMIPDTEKRLIHMSLSRYRQFVSIEISNYCMDKPSFENGLPVTTKKDRQNHGFGTKSILYTVEKYHGTVKFEAKEGQFSVKILIPLPA